VRTWKEGQPTWENVGNIQRPKPIGLPLFYETRFILFEHRPNLGNNSSSS